MKQATGFIKSPLRSDRFDLSTPQKTKTILILFGAYQRSAGLRPIIPLQKKKKEVR